MRRIPSLVSTDTIAESSTGDELLTVELIVDGSEHATVGLSGELDLTNAALVAQVLSDQIARGRRFVRLDLSELTFLNSAGLRVIALAHNDFLAAGGSLVLTGVGPRLARLLRITRLDTALRVAVPAPLTAARHLTSVNPVTSPRR